MRAFTFGCKRQHMSRLMHKLWPLSPSTSRSLSITTTISCELEQRLDEGCTKHFSSLFLNYISDILRHPLCSNNFVNKLQAFLRRKISYLFHFTQDKRMTECDSSLLANWYLIFEMFSNRPLLFELVLRAIALQIKLFLSLILR